MGILETTSLGEPTGTRDDLSNALKVDVCFGLASASPENRIVDFESKSKLAPQTILATINGNRFMLAVAPVRAAVKLSGEDA